MTVRRKKLFVLEGPAGSGKSTLLKELVRRQQIHLLNPFMQVERPRAYLGLEGIQHSIIKDSLTGMALLLDNRRTGSIPAADRWVFSQLVYGSIRRTVPVYRHMVIGALERAAMLLRTLSGELDQRQGLPVTPMEIELSVAFLLPSEALLKANRESADRSFPYQPWQELEYYRIVADGVAQLIVGSTRFHELGMRIHTVALFPETLEDLSRLPVSLTQFIQAANPQEVVA